MGRPATEALVHFANPRPGMRILDVAAGTGEPAISLAGAVLPDGHVAALDLNRGLLEIAGQRARQRELRNVSLLLADAHELPLRGESVDLVTSRLGIMFFADPGKALGEMRRVLKPGGRVAFLAWGPFEQPYFEATVAVVHKVLGANSPARPPDMFRFAAEGSLSSQLVAAGFVAVHEQLALVPWQWQGPPQELWDYFREVTAPFRDLIESVPADKVSTVEREVLAAIGRYYDGTSVNFSARFVLAGATK